MLIVCGSGIFAGCMRGVPPDLQDQYRSSQPFRCRDGAKEAPANNQSANGQPLANWPIGSLAVSGHLVPQPLLQVAFTEVNDDFCDCDDGSDEPGLRTKA